MCLFFATDWLVCHDYAFAKITHFVVLFRETVLELRFNGIDDDILIGNIEISMLYVVRNISMLSVL
jgi:hypothetical protein